MRRGWTTGACAAAASKAACAALLNGTFPDPVTIKLPGGQTPAFALARHRLDSDDAMAAIVKDAGDDPDVTHGALIEATVRRHSEAGLKFVAGPGVGTVTRPGLPLSVGEPAINPVPRKMIAAAIADIAGGDDGFEVEISVPGGEKLARGTMNGRLGIVGGISILGTTGIVIPYSCSSWIHSIHRGIDVARAAGYDHVAGSTGSTSEDAVRAMHGLAEQQLLDMGDFVGGTLKYLKTHPVARVTLAGGLAKMTKLAQGMLDLHSARGSADLTMLSELAVDCGGADDLAERIGSANTVAEAFDHARKAGIALGDTVAAKGWATAAAVLDNPKVELEVILFDRDGRQRGRREFAPTGHVPRPLKRR